jgi:glutathione S-transferase
MKVRIALAYKGIAYEKVPVDAEDRTEVVRVSGQPLTPVLAHGERVVFDSAAILRYLEANFRDTPRLFSTDYATMHEIEDWESFARDELVEPVGIVFGQFFSESPDPAALGRASSLLHARSGRIEERLAKGRWLVGESMTAADVTAAPAVWYGMLPDEAAESSPVARFFAESLRLGDARDRARDWAARVMAYDR